MQMEVMGSSGHSTTVVYVTVAGLGVFLALVAALAALNHSHHNKMYGARCVFLCLNRSVCKCVFLCVRQS